MQSDFVLTPTAAFRNTPSFSVAQMVYNSEKKQQNLLIEQISERIDDIDFLFNKYQRQEDLRTNDQFFKLLTSNLELIHKLLQICLQPRKFKAKSSRWPFMARNILVDHSRVIGNLQESCVLWILEFLVQFREGTNQQQQGINRTILGYFQEIICLNYGIKGLNSIQIQLSLDEINCFQQKILSCMTKNKKYYDLALKFSFYPQIFKFLFQCSTSLGIAVNNQFKQQILKTLFYNAVDASDHLLEYLENVYNMTQAILENFIMVAGTILIAQIIKLIQQKYTAQLVQMLKLRLNSFQKIRHTIQEQQGQFIFLILTNILKLYQKISQQIKINGFKIDLQLVFLLETNIKPIVYSLQSVVPTLLKRPNRERKFSTGEQIQEVGFLNLYGMEMIRTVLELDCKLVGQVLDPSKGLLLLLCKYMMVNRWNNFMHAIIEQIINLLINKYENYEHYEDRYIGKDGFLCFLIENFRSRHFLFLDTNNISTYGNTHFMYKIAKNIALALSSQQKLRVIMKKFQPWEIFIKQDLNKYQNIWITECLGGESPKHHSETDFIGMSVRQLLELQFTKEPSSPRKSTKLKRFASLKSEGVKRKEQSDNEFKDQYYDFRFVKNNFGWQRGK